MRIAFYGDSPLTGTAYGNIIRNLGLQLARRGFKVAFFELQRMITDYVDWIEGTRLYAGDLITVNNGIEHFRPDLLIHVRDNWVFCPHWTQIQTYSFRVGWERFGFKQINYTPIQAYPLPDEFVKSILNEAHLTLITNRWGMEKLIKYDKIPEDRIDYLYHGVDRKVFKRLDNIKEDNSTKRFVFVGANYDYRKNIGFLVKAFKEYKEITGDKNAMLYLHTNRTGYVNLMQIIKALKLNTDPKYPDVIFKEDKYQGVMMANMPLPEGKLNERYNWGNVYVTATISEGFNLPLLEAQAVGLPSIATDFPVHRELFSKFDRVVFSKSHNDYTTAWGFEWMPDFDEFVENMIKIKAGKADYPDELFKEYDWSNITDRLLKIIDEKLKI